MVPRSAVPMMARSASAVIAFALPLRAKPIGFFFGFDFLAEFLFFGVPASAFFAFVVDFFDRDRFVFSLVAFAFAVVGFGIGIG
jgi:hypothetical protein